MWQPSAKDHDTPVPGGPWDTKTTLYYHMRLAAREWSLDEMQAVCVSSVPLSQLWTESFDPSQWTIVLFWSVGESSVGEVPVPPGIVNEHLPAPPLPPPGQGLVVVPPHQPLIPGQPGSDHCLLTIARWLQLLIQPLIIFSADDAFVLLLQGDPPDTHHR